MKIKKNVLLLMKINKQKRKMKFFYILPFISIINNAMANPLACAVCTVAIAGGLGISRALGVDDAVIGVWLGSALLALSQWTAYFFEKKGIKNKIVKILSYISWYALIIPLYLGETPKIAYNFNKILGVDGFLLSIIMGSLTLFASVKLYRYMKEKNGKPHFPFEKVALPVASLLAVSFIFFLITKA